MGSWKGCAAKVKAHFLCYELHAVKRDRQTAFTLIELVAVIAIIGVMGGLLLNRMRFYQEQAEKAAMEQTVGVLRSALHLHLASLVAKNRLDQIPSLLEKNPMDLLSEKPSNYAGEFYGLRSENVVSGHWYFDLRNRNLIYSVGNSAHFRTEQNYSKQIHFRLELVRNSTFRSTENPSAINTGVGVEGITLTEVAPYTWF